MIYKIECGKCSYKGEPEYSPKLCGEVCPKCGALVFPDWIREALETKDYPKRNLEVM